MPPGNRREWRAHRIWWRPRTQETSSRDGEESHCSGRHAIRLTRRRNRRENARGPQYKLGASGLNGCSAVSYFSARGGSIIGAGRLSFGVRDGSGRFPAAVAAVTLFYFQPQSLLVLFGGGVWSVRRVWMCG